MSLHDFDAKARIDHLKHDGSTLCPPHASESLNSYVQHSMRWFRLLASTVHLSSLISDIGKEKHFLYVQLYFFFKKKTKRKRLQRGIHEGRQTRGKKKWGIIPKTHGPPAPCQTLRPTPHGSLLLLEPSFSFCPAVKQI